MRRGLFQKPPGPVKRERTERSPDSSSASSIGTAGLTAQLFREGAFVAAPSPPPTAAPKPVILMTQHAKTSSPRPCRPIGAKPRPGGLAIGASPAQTRPWAGRRQEARPSEPRQPSRHRRRDGRASPRQAPRHRRRAGRRREARPSEPRRGRQLAQRRRGCRRRPTCCHGAVGCHGYRSRRCRRQRCWSRRHQLYRNRCRGRQRHRCWPSEILLEILLYRQLVPEPLSRPPATLEKMR